MLLFTHIYSMDETVRSERRILKEQWLLEKSVQTVAVPLQSVVQGAYIKKEMTTTAFSSNITSQIHLIFYAEEDQTSVYQCKMIIFDELSTAIHFSPKIFKNLTSNPHQFKQYFFTNLLLCTRRGWCPSKDRVKGSG